MIRARAKKTMKILVPALLILAVAFLVVSRRLKYRSFEGEIVSFSVERYLAPDEPGLPVSSLPGLSYEVKRMKIRTEKGGILDLAMYVGDLDEKSVGKKLKGTYKRGRILEIKGENIIFGFIDLLGPKIELRGSPDGVIRAYEMGSAQVR